MARLSRKTHLPGSGKKAHSSAQTLNCAAPPDRLLFPSTCWIIKRNKMEIPKPVNHHFKILNGIETALNICVFTAVLTIACLRLLDRFFPGDLFPWTSGTGDILLAALAWLGVSSGIAKNSHTCFELFVRRFTPGAKKIAALWNLNLFLLYLLLVGFFTAGMIFSPSPQSGIICIRFCILAGCLLAFIRALHKEIRIIRDKEQMYISGDCMD
jgi:TRAP-type C4-dicarboxylate transport system permease small subunit